MSDWAITRPYGHGGEFWMLRKRLFWWEWRAATGENISTRRIPLRQWSSANAAASRPRRV